MASTAGVATTGAAGTSLYPGYMGKFGFWKGTAITSATIAAIQGQLAHSAGYP